MSKAQMGLIACKLSGGERQYERELDFGNGEVTRVAFRAGEDE
jgi:hypothetical protein